MNTKGTLFNFIDVIIAFVWGILIVIFFIIFLGNNSRIHLLDDGQPVEITLKVEKSLSAHYGLIKENDVIRFADSRKVLGTIKSVEYNRSSVFDIDESDNDSNIRFYPDLHDCIITIESTAEFDGKKFIINGESIEVSNVISFEVPEFSSKSTVTSIEVIK